MSEYVAPVADIVFALDALVGFDEVASLPGYNDVGLDLAQAVLEEAGRFAAGVLAPLNARGDREGVVWTDDEVRTPKGFREAYAQYVAAGWNNVAVDAGMGGQGLPHVIATAVSEFFMAANKAFSMCPGLTLGAIEALQAAAPGGLRDRYLPHLVSGRWAGTMNLTEPQAGSDVGAIRCRAVLAPDGSYRLQGQKTFISFGEHDLTENIVHLVLARLPDAPPGVKGLSLFLVPKFLPDANGNPGVRNDVRCVSVEHKMGIHGSPTCVMAYGDQGGAMGDLVGEPNQGLKAMFVMMNAARLNVGMEGVALAERAYQQALRYARERTQGRDPAGGGGPVAIIRHPDVRRMLMLMKSQIEAMRGLALIIAKAQDLAHRHPDPARRDAEKAFLDLITPVFKGWATETGVEVTSLGIQIHGGMGYIEETGAAQHLRDARISTIYEGTTGIQAADLIGRKMAHCDGVAFEAVIMRMRALSDGLAETGGALGVLHARFLESVDALEHAGQHLLLTFHQESAQALAVSVPFLQLFGKVAGAWQLMRAALEAQRRIARGEGDPGFLAARITVAQFYAEHVLVQAWSLAETVIHGGQSALVLEDEQF